MGTALMAARTGYGNKGYGSRGYGSKGYGYKLKNSYSFGGYRRSYGKTLRSHKKSNYRGGHGKGYGQPVYGYRSPCRQVEKLYYLDVRKALMGGIACPDAYGNYYVVPESRYLIKFH